jgi:predicted restriction endonuclease
MKEKILKLRAEGKTYDEIKKEIGCSKSTISYYCSSGQQQKARERNRKNRMNICSCGNQKYIISKVCETCMLKNKRDIILNKTILQFEKEYYNNNRYFIIRKYARTFLKESGITKECKICKFNHHVEACHIKPISNFPKSALLSQVNSIDNLVYLCPNHHIMFDKGLIKL